jgi:hypothetical protein
MAKVRPVLKQEAREIGEAALGFLAADPDRLIRFLQLTGTSPAELRRQADADSTLAAVLSHLLDDESLLLVFAAEVGIAADRIGPAAALLAGAREGRP